MPNTPLIEIPDPYFNDDDGLRAARGIRNALIVCTLFWLLVAVVIFC